MKNRSLYDDGVGYKINNFVKPIFNRKDFVDQKDIDF